MAKSKRPRKQYTPKPIKDTLHEYSDDLTNKEVTFSQLRETYRHLKCAVDNGRSALTGEGFAMLRDALELHEGLIENSTEYIVKQIVGVCSYRAHKGEWRVAA